MYFIQRVKHQSYKLDCFIKTRKNLFWISVLDFCWIDLESYLNLINMMIDEGPACCYTFVHIPFFLENCLSYRHPIYSWLVWHKYFDIETSLIAWNMLRSIFQRDYFYKSAHPWHLDNGYGDSLNIYAWLNQNASI